MECSVYAGMLDHLLHIRHADLGATECEVMRRRWCALILIHRTSGGCPRCCVCDSMPRFAELFNRVWGL